MGAQNRRKKGQKRNYGKQDIVYSEYYSEVDFIKKEKDLLAYNQVKKELKYITEKGLGRNFQSITYSDYYTTDKKISAYTLKLKKNGKYKKKRVKGVFKTNITSSGIFYDDTIEEYTYYSNLNIGDKSVFVFSASFIDPALTPRLLFNAEIFAEKIKYKINVPDFMNVKLVLFGDSTGINHTTVKTQTSTVHYYEALNRDEIIFEDESSNFTYYTPHLFVVPIDYKSDGKTVPVVGNEANLFERYRASLKEMESSDNTQLFKLTDSLVAGVTDSMKIVETLYNWVQRNIKYIAFEEGRGGYVPRPAEKVFKNRYGDCKDKSNLLVTMLTHAGVNAYHTWIGTRNKPYNYKDLPSPHCDDHMIVNVTCKGVNFFLDATQTYGQIGLPSSFVQGKQAFVKINDSNYVVRNVPVGNVNQSSRIDSVKLHFENEKIVAKCNRSVNGYLYELYSHQIQHAENKPGKLMENIALGNNKLEIKNFKWESSDNAHSINMNYDAELPNYMQVFNDEIYFNPHLFKDFYNDLIDLDQRKLDIENEYKYTLKDYVAVEIPNPKKIVSIPQNVKYQNDDFSFEISYKLVDKTILIDKVIEINHLILKKENFKEWNTMMGSLLKAYSNVIVIKK